MCPKFSIRELILHQQRIQGGQKDYHRQAQPPKQPDREENLIQIFYAWLEAAWVKLKTHKNGSLAHDKAIDNQK